MIVVGDRPVTGAGCIEAFTPLDNIGDPFDDRMETIRNRSEAIADPDTAQRYRDFATAYAKDWAAEHGDHLMYSLDQLGRASCRERVCQYVEFWVVADTLKKKK